MVMQLIKLIIELINNELNNLRRTENKNDNLESNKKQRNTIKTDTEKSENSNISKIKDPTLFETFDSSEEEITNENSFIFKKKHISNIGKMNDITIQNSNSTKRVFESEKHINKPIHKVFKSKNILIILKK